MRDACLYAATTGAVRAGRPCGPGEEGGAARSRVELPAGDVFGRVLVPLAGTVRTGTLAATCADEPPEPPPTFAATDACGVRALAVTFAVPVPLVLALTEVVACAGAGVETAVETEAAGEPLCVLACTEADAAGAGVDTAGAGVDTAVDAEAAGEPLCVLTLTEADAAGVLTEAPAVPLGAAGAETCADADAWAGGELGEGAEAAGELAGAAETAGATWGVGAPGRPSANADAVQKSPTKAPATVQMKRRKPGFRGITVSSLVEV